MSPGDVVTSPVLVGRDELLAHARRRLEVAADGRGQLLFVAGEAGIGKTRMLAAISRQADALGFGVVRAAAYRGDAETSGGVLLDLSGDLRRAPDPAAQSVGSAISERLRLSLDPSVVGAGDPHRHRRLLIQDLADAVSDLGLAGPLLIVLEDLHWADQLSLEVIAHAAARMTVRSTLVLAAFRSDELYPGSAAREWRSRLLSQRLAEEIRLPRLTRAETATLTSAVLGGPASAQMVGTLHDRSDGIPLHIEELLAAAGGTSAAGDLGRSDLGDVEDVRVPETLADAVLSRARTLDASARSISAAAVVIGRSFDFDLLTAVTESDPEEVDACLRQLRSLHLIQAGGTTDTFDFRHALIRDALYAEIPLPRRRVLHARVALVAGSRGYRSAFVSAHYDQAQLSAPAYRHALLAAQEAAGVSAHREALELYRRALRNLSPDAGPQEQAGLLAALGAEAAAVDENAAAADAFARAHALWLEAGDCLSAAAIVPGLVSARHLLGEGLDTRVRRLEEELEALHGVPGADPVNALLLGALSAAYLVNDGLDDAIFYGEQSRKLSHATGNEEVELNTAATLGSVLVFAGQMEAGWALLENAIGRSVTLEHEAEAGRGYRLIGSSASALVEYDRAELWLNRGIAYSETAELWNHHSYMATHLAHVQWASGQWDEAQRTAEHALADGRGGITTQNTALYVLGYLAIGRGEYDKGIELLTEAIDLGEAMAELQRISPPLWGLAEAALLNGDFDRAVTLSERGYAASEQVADAAYLFPFLVTGLRARLALDDPAGAAEWLARVEAALRRRNVPGTLPAIAHARGLLQLESGDLRAAAESLESARAGWLEHRRFWEGTWVLLDQARCAFRAKRFADAATLSEATRNLAETVGASALVAAVEALQLEQRAQPEQPWHPLTAREYDVAALVAAGLTNREIAAQLFLAPKTVSAHVEHILTKLGAGRRAEIAAWAARIGG